MCFFFWLLSQWEYTESLGKSGYACVYVDHRLVRVAKPSTPKDDWISGDGAEYLNSAESTIGKEGGGVSAKSYVKSDDGLYWPTTFVDYRGSDGGKTASPFPVASW